MIKFNKNTDKTATITPVFICNNLEEATI